MKNLFGITLFISLFATHLRAQTIVYGTVKGDNGAAILGAKLNLLSTPQETSSQKDGSYFFYVKPGTYTITCDTKGYKKQEAKVDAAGDSIRLDFTLKAASKSLDGISTKASAKKESISSMLNVQRTSTTIMDVVSAEAIKQMPARTSAEVIKRIGGITIADNKFIIVRGLSDRYNAPYLNGAALPSTDAERRAFAFDILPSNAIDNIMVVKTATPDLPGDFAGASVLINTKETNKSNSTSVQLGLNGNSLATFQPYFSSPKGSLDWLGVDDGMRQLPANTPANIEAYSQLNYSDKVALTKQFNNGYVYNFDKVRMPGAQVMLTNNHVWMNKGARSFTSYAAINYNRNYRQEQIFREDRDVDSALNFQSRDIADRSTVLTSGILNLNYNINDRSRISLRSFASNTGEEINTFRLAIEPIQDFQKKLYVNTFGNSFLASTQLLGNHKFTPGKQSAKLEWLVGYSSINRNIPDLRTTSYRRMLSDTANQAYYVGMNQFPNILEAGRFYSNLAERLPTARIDFTTSIGNDSGRHSIKAGLYSQMRQRTFSARRMGYTVNPFSLSTLNQLSPDKLFDSSSIGKDQLLLQEGTQPSDAYDANVSLLAAYAMSDNYVTPYLRIVWGARVENFSLKLNSNDGLNDRTYERNYLNFLPSAIATVMLDAKTNLRLSASKTVSRPEFREIAPFAFFDFNTNSLLVGYDSLQQCKITNLDVRYESFPSKGEMYSASLFYKYFDSPIEQRFFSTGAGSQTRTYKNYDRGTLYGAEVEFRRSLQNMLTNSSAPIVKNTSLYGNLAYMVSNVDFTISEVEYRRPMQGQSSYVINLGTTYNANKLGLVTSLNYNRIGPRIAMVGDNTEATLWEKPRDVLDIVLSKSINKKLDLRFTASDLLSQDFILYQNDLAGTIRKYTPNQSFRFATLQAGRNFSLSCTYKFD